MSKHSITINYDSGRTVKYSFVKALPHPPLHSKEWKQEIRKDIDHLMGAVMQLIDIAQENNVESKLDLIETCIDKLNEI